jgi:isopenicillin-N N-acyltransferase-like protein
MEKNEAIFYHNPPPLVRVAGSHRQIGCQIGEACRNLIQHSVQSAQALVDSAFPHLQLTWEGAITQSRKYIPFIEERYPQYIEEMYGIAEGANTSFDEIAVVNALEAVTMDALHLTKCTSFAVNETRTADGHVLVAHNEDWLPEDEADIFLIHATPQDEPPFLAMTYGGLLPNIGLNTYGLAQCCDSVYPTDTRIGTPRVVVSRAVLAARTIDGAIRATTASQRAAGYNHLIAHESGELYNIEVSARNSAILYAQDGAISHTNHYLDPKMQAIEDEPEEMVSTRIRYFRADRLLRQSRSHTVETLQAILRDHTNFPDSICNHSIHELDPMDRETTICSLVMDLNERTLDLAWGNPCVNRYHTFRL